jgi:Asp-tRNA(Asn)/Glu-tRNA(Gln) amidotransferase A subunit family amidase|tara:strand:+ start:4983 stop:6383 length:1401 start_codon:yes stop_codon:yes gene_type:complete
MDFRDITVIELAEKIRSKEISAIEVTQATLDNIDRLDGELNAFCAVNSEDALAQAEALDRRIASGETPGPLTGIPIGVKDLEDARGFVTTYGSALHVEDAPATDDSVLVARLRAAGCVIVGKTNTPEFGYKGMTDNIPFGASRNPWNKERTPGGSSGGSAAALASGIIPLATGSDGGGSIRIPAALCGFSGIKTSQGRVPNGGSKPPGSGILSVKGPMALRTRDTAFALDVCVGDHPSDIFALPRSDRDWSSQLDTVNPPAKVIWSPTMGFAKVDREILGCCEKVLHKLADNGVEIIENDRIWEEDPVTHWMPIWVASRARAQGDLKGTDGWDLIDRGLRFQIEMGLTNVSGADYAKAVDACHSLNLKLQAAFESAPLILTPTTCGQTPKLEGGGFVNGEETPSWVAFTYGINMTRNPAGTVVAGLTEDGMPVGLQVIGPQRQDVSVLSGMAYLEDVIGFDQRAAC